MTDKPTSMKLITSCYK